MGRGRRQCARMPTCRLQHILRAVTVPAHTRSGVGTRRRLRGEGQSKNQDDYQDQTLEYPARHVSGSPVYYTRGMLLTITAPVNSFLKPPLIENCTVKSKQNRSGPCMNESFCSVRSLFLLFAATVI